MKLYTSTVKYFSLAIKEFVPLIKDLIKSSLGSEKDELEDLLEMYSDIATKIDQYNLNLADPNRFYKDEPEEVVLDISEDVLENLVGLVLRLLEKWKQDVSSLKNKKYLTDKNQEKLLELEEMIWPLEGFIKAPSYILSRYSAQGPLVFPSENKKLLENDSNESLISDYIPLFPKPLVELMPGGIKTLCEEFDFNYKNAKPNACMLLLRKILPLAIVRKFQQIGKEEQIKLGGEYMQTQILLDKAQTVMSSGRIYKDIMNYKFLIDSSQHVFSINGYMDDIPRPATAIRIMLEDFFKN